MKPQQPISICWLRRDLRLNDNTALYHALKSDYPVLLVFIFDQNILDKLQNKADARVSFIHQTLSKLQEKLVEQNSSLLVKYNNPLAAWTDILANYEVKEVYANHDYEPYALKRDSELSAFFEEQKIAFKTFKDQVIFEKNEVVKTDGKPYTVFTPYFKIWLQKLNALAYAKQPSEAHFSHLFATTPMALIDLKDMGFEESNQKFPDLNFEQKLAGYETKRDYPATDATTYIGLHLRF
jgi:deoxyribodipyrimidine photo-lyase